MEINGTIIADDEIIGCSNIEQFRPNQLSVCWRYYVITKQNRVPITSDPQSTLDPVSGKKALLEFQMLYIKNYKEIFRKTHDPVNNNSGWDYPKYITTMEEDVKRVWTEMKIDQQKNEN